MKESTDSGHTHGKARHSGYFAVDPSLVMQLYRMYDMRPGNFSAGGKPGALSVYYDAKKILEGKSENKWGHHTEKAIEDFCYFTQVDGDYVWPWHELVAGTHQYDGLEGTGPRTGNRLLTTERFSVSAQKIRENRERLNLTQDQLAAATGLPRRLIEAVENSDWNTLAKTTIDLIAAALNIDINSLLIHEKSQPRVPLTKQAVQNIRAIVMVCAVVGLAASVFVIYTSKVAVPKISWITVESTEAGSAIGTFALSSHEITNRDFWLFIQANRKYSRDRITPGMHDGDYLKHWLDNDHYPPDLHDHPVTYVSWYTADAFCQWLGARLPRLHEWRLATETLPLSLSTGDVAMINICDRRCVMENKPPGLMLKEVTVDDGFTETAPVTVGLKHLGFTHLYGNVAEWLNETSGESGGIIGGSYRATLADALSRQPVPAPKRLASRDTGFRCARPIAGLP